MTVIQNLASKLEEHIRIYAESDRIMAFIQRLTNSLKGKASHTGDNNFEPSKSSAQREVQVLIDVATTLKQQEHIAESKQQAGHIRACTYCEK